MSDVRRTEEGWLGAWVESRVFQRASLALILANAIALGLETSLELTARFATLVAPAERFFQIAFAAEIALRIAAFGRRPWEFFRSGWNCFDFAVVSLSLLPVVGPLANLARLARVLRVARLVSVLPELRLIVGTMLRSIPSLGHVILLLGILHYVYAVLGCQLFRDDAPEQWGTLAAALGSLFQVVTLEGWVELQDAVSESHPFAWLYFSSFIVIAVFVMINLFVAVVINNLEETRREELESGEPAQSPVRRLAALRAQLEAIEGELERSSHVRRSR